MSVRDFLGTLLSLCACAALAACIAQLDEPVPGMYRATLALPGGAAPFGLEIAKEQQRYVLYLTNGSERTRVSNVDIRNRELIAVFPGYENTLRAKMFRQKLAGSVTLLGAGGKPQVIPLEATLGDTWRFNERALTDNADVAGQWEMTFTGDDGVQTRAIALFEQHHDRVTGTVMTPTGDHRFLEGQVHGDEVQLSTFAGGLAYLYKLRVNAQGGLEGDYWQGLAAHERIVAQRNDAATLARMSEFPAQVDGLLTEPASCSPRGAVDLSIQY
jgi:hypothetical protein